MKQFFLQMFTWWNRQTVGTRFYTWRKGEVVGRDEFGNTYYREAKRDKRWVIYHDVVEASSVPPGWNGWLHHTVDAPLAEADTAPVWRKEHVPNLTGTSAAHRPQGHMLGRHHTEGERRYRPWRPS